MNRSRHLLPFGEVTERLRLTGRGYVGLAHEHGQEFIEAEVVRLATNYRLPPDVDVPQLVHTKLRRMFMEQSGLELVQPDVDISFSSPAGYLQLLEAVKGHGWDLTARLGRMPSRGELAQSWLKEIYQPGMRALQEAELTCPERDATDADAFLWLYQRRGRYGRADHARLTATAVYDIRHPRRLFRRERRELRRAAKGLPTVDQELVPAGS
jgi:hypothetical protein